jgi:hypothetical protein
MLAVLRRGRRPSRAESAAVFRAGEADVGLRAATTPGHGHRDHERHSQQGRGPPPGPGRFTGGTVTCASTSPDELEPSPDIGDLLREIDRDPIAIFWG